KDLEEEIIAKEAHEEYVEFLNENPNLSPYFRIFHMKGTERKSKVDWWSYTNSFLMMSGKLTNKEAQGLLRAGRKQK
ncbi:MAG: hypothetical protein ACW99X_18005, partial [Candidatus Thorarchaeota archaeon]